VYQRKKSVASSEYLQQPPLLSTSIHIINRLDNQVYWHKQRRPVVGHGYQNDKEYGDLSDKNLTANLVWRAGRFELGVIRFLLFKNW